MVAIIQTSSPMTIRRADSLILTTNKRPRTARPERCVKFGDNHLIVEIPSRESFSQQELDVLYLSKWDQRQIRTDIVDLIREFKRDQEPWGGKELERLRGLEPLTNHDDDDRMPRLKGAVSAVIERQLNGSIDEAWLSKVYRPFSQVAQSLALRRAQMDSYAAYYDAPRTMVMSR